MPQQRMAKRRDDDARDRDQRFEADAGARIDARHDAQITPAVRDLVHSVVCSQIVQHQSDGRMSVAEQPKDGRQADGRHGERGRDLHLTVAQLRLGIELLQQVAQASQHLGRLHE